MRFDNLKGLVEHLINRRYFVVDGENVYDTIRNSLRYRDDSIGWRNINEDSNNESDVKIVSNDLNALREDISNHFDAFISEAQDEYNISSREEAIEKLDNPVVSIQAFGDNENEYGYMTFDNSIGIPSDQFEDAVGKNLADAGIDKRKNSLLLGEFGQGSFSSIGMSSHGCKLIVSISKDDQSVVSFTITQKKNGNYKYMSINSEMPSFTLDESESLDLGDTIDFNLTKGTITKVFDVDRTKTRNSIRNSSFKRRFGYKYPDPIAPIRLYDSRAQESDTDYTEWDGLLSNVEDLEKSDTFNTKVEHDDLGEIDITAVVPKKGETFSTEYISTNDPRTFFTLHGMTHETKSRSITASDFGLDRISNECLLFIECEGMTVDVSEVFEVDRNGMKESGRTRDIFYNFVTEEVRNWDELTGVNDERNITPDQLSHSPIDSIESVTADVSTQNRTTVEYDIVLDDAADSSYLEEAELQVKSTHKRGRADVVGYSVNGSKLNVTLDPDYEKSALSMGQILLEDKSLNKTVEGTFILEDPTDRDQSNRSKTGTEFEDRVRSLLEEYQIEGISITTKKSNLPNSVEEQLQIKYPDGEQVFPDADIVVHNESEPLAVVSCKKSIRERLTQTQSWYNSYNDVDHLETSLDHLPFFFVTSDPDGELDEGRKPRSVSSALSGTFVLDNEFENYNDYIYPFEELVENLRSLI